MQLRGLAHVYLPETRTTVLARPGGALRRQNEEENTILVTGDRVTLDRDGDENGEAVILSRLPRTSLLTRAEAGSRERAQPLCANADLLLLCTSMNEEFNAKRLDRYLAIADGAGIPALILLTKADMAKHPQEQLRILNALDPRRAYIVCSAKTGQGIAEIHEALDGRTAALLGSSGVGKSSLINALLGEEHQRVSQISGYKDKGRHTTTARELIPLENGFLIDTPGMRELKLDVSDAAASFADVTQIAQNCRFSDCAHGHEPGCAVREALAKETLSQARFDSYTKLRAEEQRRQARKTYAKR